MTAGGNRNALNRETGADGLRDWSYDLLDCSSTCSLCCWATFCPCVVYGQNKQRLRHLQYEGVALSNGGSRVSSDCRAFCCSALPCFYWVFQMGGRTNVRNRYDIRGNSFEDFLSSVLCVPCALTQESREIELEEKSLSS
ncbi:PLAC8 family-domain-containing protein [Russula earlei]|uniref:PLAC8 family-domain-containing protein n=1 Tax=Russula earlei TaxID=71964 RepID=A0ACC0U9E8_9AGAM|nr:PLAC8 family-domain-containing protein [Russula earlei]